jgi:hypothetical protein
MTSVGITVERKERRVSDVKPALTEEEWDRVLHPSKARMLPDEPDEPDDIAESIHMAASAATDFREYHKAAALVTYGQRFGFTREDAKECRWAAETIEIESDDHDGADRLRSIADRIAALLPPSDSTRAQDE